MSGRSAIVDINKHSDKFVGYGAFCIWLDEETSTVALAWVLSNATIPAPIVKPRTLEQLEQSIRVLEIEISPEHIKQVDAI
jgi:aryl-alcohol dehydrogenase-like predicted oxidoreductase